jgi:hypothetical protein
MEINDLKPDFEKIISVFHSTTIIDDDIPISESSKLLWKSIGKDWERIIKGEIPYESKDNINLTNLIKENSLEPYYNDLLFFAFRFIERNKGVDDINKWMKSIKGEKKELLNALKFLYDNEIIDTKIVLKHKTRNLSITINNQLLINLIKESLLKEFIDTDSYFKQEFIKPEEVEDWGKYFSFLLLEEEAKQVKKGRKKKPGFTGSFIDTLQIYLQEYTELKADKEISISRKQASFIFKFLDVLDLIPDSLTWEEDNIRHMVNKFRAIRMEKIPFDYKLGIKEYSEYSKKKKSKLKNISKNK